MTRSEIFRNNYKYQAKESAKNEEKKETVLVSVFSSKKDEKAFAKVAQKRMNSHKRLEWEDGR